MPEISALALAPLYERDTPVMSRAVGLKAGEKGTQYPAFATPVHLLPEGIA